MRFNCTCYHHCKLDDCANGNCFECTGPKSFCRLSKWNIRARREICSARIEPGTRTYSKRMRFTVKREDALAKDALISRIRENRGGAFEIANDGPRKKRFEIEGGASMNERASMITIVSAAPGPPRLMRCKQFNAKLSTTIGSLSFFPPCFPIEASPDEGASSEHRLTRYIIGIVSRRRALYGPSVPPRFQTRPADGSLAILSGNVPKVKQYFTGLYVSLAPRLFTVSPLALRWRFIIWCLI